jgi:excisionase family DNA binding protein
MANLEGLPPTITVEHAGRLLGLGRSAAYEAVRRSELPVLRFGRRMVVPTARVLAMLGLGLERDEGAPAFALIDQHVPASPARDHGGS